LQDDPDELSLVKVGAAQVKHKWAKLAIRQAVE
jgi:hypothetical protein